MMWKTRDGYVLCLGRERARTIAAQLRHGPARELLRRNYRGSLAPAIVRTAGQIAHSASLIGFIRDAATTRRYPVFASHVEGSDYHIVTRPLAGDRNEVAAILAGSRQQVPERGDGPGHARTRAAVLDHLQAAAGLSDKNAPAVIRVNQQQVRADGSRSGRPTNTVDVSYVDLGGTRVNVALDTDRAQLQRRSNAIDRDPGARNVALLIDNWSGQVIGGTNREPGGPSRQLGPEELPSAIASLSVPRQEPAPDSQRSDSRRQRWVPARGAPIATRGPGTPRPADRSTSAPLRPDPTRTRPTARRREDDRPRRSAQHEHANGVTPPAGDPLPP